MIGLYPWISRVAGLKPLKNVPDTGKNKSILTVKLLKMAETVLKNNAVEFHFTVKEQILGTAIRTECTPG